MKIKGPPLSRKCQIIELSNDGATCSHGSMLKIVDQVSHSFHHACSAFRNKGECEKQHLYQNSTTRNWSLEGILRISQSDRAYCYTCDCLFSLSLSGQKHEAHEYKKNLSNNLLGMPSYLLKPLKDSKAHAQYFFSLDCLNQLYSIIQKLSVNYVICIGSPRLHDFIQLHRIHKGQLLDSYLLDMDFRLSSFYSSHRFSRFNMVNGFFFGENEEGNFHNFIKDHVKPSDKCLIFCDPPFASPLSLIMKQIRTLSKSIIQCISNFQITENNCASLDENHIPYLLALPFFFEKKLQKIAPFLNLLDYKITYENHSRLDCDITDNGDHGDANNRTGDSSNRGQRRDSIVRLFTSLPPSLVHPPKAMEKYFRFCEICQRYSHILNLHCPKCDRCTTKSGPTYVHCDKCGRCRPAKKFHCNKCKHCVSVNQCVHRFKRKKLHSSTPDYC
ncbi:unnamed protein product [Schistosoma turkestanicum]|nr:unnamed protein product [Schistosoma turkestanicum]